ncbi:MAG: nuclear transport factor 2 family protein [bacterium]
MNQSELEGLCDAWLRAWSGNRPADLLACYSEGAFYRDPARPEGLRGQEALRIYFEKLLAKNPDWVWRRQELIPTARGFVLKWEASIPHRGAATRIEGLDIVELEGRKISRNEVYFDPLPLRQ